MSKSVYAWAAAVVVVAVGGFLVFKNSGSNGSAAPQTNSAPTSGSEVIYNGSGFSPSNLLVSVGTTVTFKNQSSSGMWVASDPHPTHTIYPAFDAKKVYAPGESYTFTFDKVGAWGYHNHLNPSAKGTITVK